jgi:hypothetical protein
MSELAVSPPKHTASQSAASDDRALGQALGQVEKWMAIIREIAPRPHNVGADANTVLLGSEYRGG